MFWKLSSLPQVASALDSLKEWVQAEPAQTPAVPTADPSLSLSTTYINFGDVQVFTPRTQFVTFTNNGSQPIRVTGISSDNYVFAVSRGQLTIPPNESRTLSITFTPQFAQTYYGNVSFRTSDPNYASGSIYLMGTGTTF
ncbi:MAG: choice-of-anchor D domain-containing protein [bacterium]